MKIGNSVVLLLLVNFIHHSAYSKTKKDLQNGDTPFETMPTTMTKDSCGKVDLADQMGPVHNQTAGTCFAYTALDLLNYGTDTRYSALYLATLKTYTPPDPNKKPLLCPGDPVPTPTTTGKVSAMDQVGGFKGGQVYAAIKLGMEKGLCPESIVPSSDGGLKKDYKVLLEYYADKADPVDCAETQDPAQKLLTEVERRNRNFDSREIRDEAKRMYPTLGENDLEEVAGMSTSVDDFVKRLNERACGDRLVRDVPPGKTPKDVTYLANSFTEGCSKYYYQEDRAPILDKINRALDQNKPVGISYITGGLIQPPKPASHGYHASVLSGRMWSEDKKECLYLVKNSWGKDWKVADGLKAKTSSKHPGYFVVTEKQLMEHVYGAATID